MKLFKNMMSRKPEPEETVGKIELDMDVEPLRRRSQPLADDSGEPNGSARAKSNDPLFADPSKPSYGRSEEPEEVVGAGWGASAWEDDDWDEDDDWGEEELDDSNAFGASDAAAGRTRSQAPDWSDDEEFGRKAIARSQLGAGGASEDRILEKTNSKMIDRESSRRHSAMAHLKAAAAATKADRVLKDKASRDPAADPEEQSPYRDDLAKVVRPRTVSRPSTRPTTRPRTISTPWSEDVFGEDSEFGDDSYAENTESGFSGFNTGDDDFADGADRFADDPTERLGAASDRFATDESAFAQDDDAEEDDEHFEGDRAAHIPDDLSEDDFAEDGPNFAEVIGDRFGLDDATEADAMSDDEIADDDAFDLPDFPVAAEPAAEEEDTFASETEDELFTDEDDFAEDAQEDEDDGPVPSTAVSEAIAMANAPDEPEEIDADEVRRKIWDISAETPVVRDPAEVKSVEAAPAPAPEPAPAPQPEPESIVDVAAAATTVTGRAGRSAGRVKTRLLGFQDPDDTSTDVFEAAKSAPAPAAEAKYPVGWIIVIEGPGHGTCFTLFNGVSQIGRGEEQAVRLDFGDTSISRNNHAAVAFDDEQTKFFLGHGGKSNLVRLNGRPVLSTEELSHGDAIRIGETTLKFIALCGEDFNWKMTDGEDADNGENA